MKKKSSGPIIVFRKNKSLKQLTGENIIQNNENMRKKENVHLENMEYGHCVEK